MDATQKLIFLVSDNLKILIFRTNKTVDKAENHCVGSNENFIEKIIHIYESLF